MATAQAFALESNKRSGWKVAVANVPYGQLHPRNMVIVADGLTRDRAWAMRIECDRRLGHITSDWIPRKF